MKAIAYFLSFMFCCSAVLMQAAEPVPVQIKSVRKCEATVEKTNGAYIRDKRIIKHAEGEQHGIGCLAKIPQP